MWNKLVCFFYGHIWNHIYYSNLEWKRSNCKRCGKWVYPK